ncbi:MAG: hypothetical protein ACJAVK_000021 [Akkermansiaceae bacterium]|jgi:hypothetical protein
MFNDFHESTRNVGMVGVLLGFLVLVGFCGLGMAVFSGLNNSDKGPSLAVRIITQEGVIEDLTDDVRKRRARMEEFEGFQSAGKLAAVKRKEILGEENLIGRHQEKVADLQDEVEAKGLSFEEYRNHYRQRVRSLAKGELIDLSETKGEGFEACKILGISPLHLRVMRKAGPIGIPYQELPRRVQDRFQFGAEEAADYKQRVAVVEARKDKQIAAFREKQKAMKADDAVADLKRQLNETTLGIQQQDNLAIKLDADAKLWENKAKALDRKAEAARSAGRITSNPGHANQARNKARGFRRQADEARTAARSLEANLIELDNLLLEKE